MPPKNSGGSTKFPGGHKVIHRTAQTAFVRVVTPRYGGIPTRKRDDEHPRRFHKGIPLRVVKIIPEVYRDHEGSLQFRMCLGGV